VLNGENDENPVAFFWDVTTGRTRRVAIPARLVKSAVSPDGSCLLTVSVAPHVADESNSLRDVRLFDTQTMQQVAELTFGKEFVFDFSPDGQLLASLVRDERRVRVVATTDGRLVKTLELDAIARNLKFSPSGLRFVTATDQEIRWWRVADWLSDGQARRDHPQVAVGAWGFSARLPAEDVVVLPDFKDNQGWLKEEDYPTYVRGRDGKLPFTIADCRDNLALSWGLHIYDLKTLRQLRSPDRFFPPEAARFAEDGRLLKRTALMDLVTGMWIGPSQNPMHIGSKGTGWFYPPQLYSYGAGDRKPIIVTAYLWIFLPENVGSLDPQSISLWANVVARGELNEDGGFERWNEATWETKRQELLRRVQPLGTFPFPGQAANDPLYWLRRAMVEGDDFRGAAFSDGDGGMVLGGGNSSPTPLARHDRLVAAEPTWQNYAARSDARGWANSAGALEDDLEAARLAGPAYWSVEPVVLSGYDRAWEVAQDPRQPASHYELVLRWTQARTQARPSDLHPALVALAMYRLGRYVDALKEANVPDVDSPEFLLLGSPPVMDVADRRTNAPLVAALCSFRLGNTELARKLVRRMQELIEGSSQGGGGFWDSSVDLRLLHEAENLIDSPAAALPPRELQ